MVPSQDPSGADQLWDSCSAPPSPTGAKDSEEQILRKEGPLQRTPPFRTETQKPQTKPAAGSTQHIRQSRGAGSQVLPGNQHCFLSITHGDRGHAGTCLAAGYNSVVNFGPDLFMIQAIQNQPIISRIGQGTFTGFGVIRTITSLCWFLISSNIVAKEAPASPEPDTSHSGPEAQ